MKGAQSSYTLREGNAFFRYAMVAGGCGAIGAGGADAKKLQNDCDVNGVGEYCE